MDKLIAVEQLAGRTVELDEVDYTYGMGRLRLRVCDAMPLAQRRHPAATPRHAS
jgi:hypothetical protein